MARWVGETDGSMGWRQLFLGTTFESQIMARRIRAMGWIDDLEYLPHNPLHQHSIITESHDAGKLAVEGPTEKPSASSSSFLRPDGKTFTTSTINSASVEQALDPSKTKENLEMSAVLLAPSLCHSS